MPNKVNWYECQIVVKGKPRTIYKTWRGEEVPDGPRAKYGVMYAGGTHTVKCEFWDSRDSKDKYCCLFRTLDQAREWADELFKIHGGKA